MASSAASQLSFQKRIHRLAFEHVVFSKLIAEVFQRQFESRGEPACEIQNLPAGLTAGAGVFVCDN